jgi:hypothetical protein
LFVYAFTHYSSLPIPSTYPCTNQLFYKFFQSTHICSLHSLQSSFCPQLRQ